MNKLPAYGSKDYHSARVERLENIIAKAFDNPTEENILEMMYICGSSMRQGVSLDAYFPDIAKRVSERAIKS